MMNAVFIKEEVCEFEEPSSPVKEEDPLSESQIDIEQLPQNINESKLYNCEICGKGYNHQASLWKHSKIHSTVKHKCENCGKEFATAQHLKSHQFYMHSDPEIWPHQCDICSKKFPQKSKLDVHLRQHTNTKSFSCEDCTKTFYTRTELKSHRRKHSEHVKKDRKVNTCPICSKEFNFKASLTYHIQAHKNEKLYKCDQCFSSFNSGKDLFTHKRRKHESTLWKHFCETCNKKFPDAAHLNKHKMNFKPYVCRVCKVKFEYDCNINSHYATHGSKAEYYCSQCDKKCKTRRGLQRHFNASHSNIFKESDIDEEWNDLY